jgi:LysM repeat protein
MPVALPAPTGSWRAGHNYRSKEGDDLMKRSRRRRLLGVVCVAVVGAIVFRGSIREWLSPVDDRTASANAPETPAVEAKSADASTGPAPSKTQTETIIDPGKQAKPAAAVKTQEKPAAPEPLKPTVVKTPKQIAAESDALTKAGKDSEAAALLSGLIVGDRVVGEARERVIAQLDKLNAKLYFSPAPTPTSEVYTVRHGDVLVRIAKPYKITPRLIMRMNRIRDAKRIRPKQRLKVMHGPFHARIDLSDFELLVLHQGRYVKRFKIGIGKDQSTPTGSFAVGSKLENPTYYDSENGVKIAADDPKNPLGERWLGTGDGYGIHGTIEPDSVGKAESRGCIRLREKDVEQVYDLLVIGSTVVIRP